MKKTLLLIAGVVAHLAAIAQTDELTVTLTEAGQLPELVGDANKMQVKSLTVVGDINGTDIAYIREMAQGTMNYMTWQRTANLQVLDLSGANLVEGGSAYSMSWPYPEVETGVIGEDMFYNCVSLIELRLPKNITRICKRGINNNTLLAELTLPEGLQVIEQWGIYWSPSLTSLDLPSTLEQIESFAFYGCAIEEITLTSNNLQFESSSFSGLSSLKNFHVNADNQSYASVDGVLYTKDLSVLMLYPGGRADATYEMPSQTKEIGDYGFYVCTSLVNVVMPEGLERIGDYAFDGDTSLGNLQFPSTLKSVGRYAFVACRNMTEADFSGTQLETVDENAFFGVQSLAVVKLSPTLKRVGASAFTGNSYKELDLPATLEYIGESGFLNEYLEVVRAHGMTPAVCEGDVFGQSYRATLLNKDRICPLYVPVGATEAYEEADGFKFFYTVIEDESLTTGIERAATADAHSSVWFSLDGKRTVTPRKGFAIERKADGSVRKYIVK